MTKNTEIFEYIRKRKGGKVVKVGIVFGTVVKDGEGPLAPQVIKIGWSKCNLKMGDKFDLLMGLQHALNRAMKPDGTTTPLCIKDQIRRFSSRCVRYFKDAQKLEMPV